MIKLLMDALRPLRNDKRAVTIIEYALLAGLIGVALATTLTTLKGSIATMFTNLGTSL